MTFCSLCQGLPEAHISALKGAFTRYSIALAMICSRQPTGQQMILMGRSTIQMTMPMTDNIARIGKAMMTSSHLKQSPAGECCCLGLASDTGALASCDVCSGCVMGMICAG